MSQRVTLRSEVKPLGVAVAKASLNRANEFEKCSDELWIGVKGQTNLEIAGSPRNIFRYSLA